MDPITCVSLILDIINEINLARRGTVANRGQKARLAERILALEVPLQAILEGKRLIALDSPHAKALEAMHGHVCRASELLTSFGEQTIARKMDRLVRHKFYAQEFISINAALSSACGDLQLTVLVSAEQRRGEDLADQQEAFREMMALVTAELKDDNEATEDTLKQIQAQMCCQHDAVMDLIIRTNGYPPLDVDEQREQFASLGSALDSIFASIRKLEGLVASSGRGNGASGGNAGSGSSGGSPAVKADFASSPFPRISHKEISHPVSPIELGSGATSTVYRVHWADVPVAMKVLRVHVNSASVAIELQRLRDLSHPLVIRVFRVCEDLPVGVFCGRMGILMEMAENGNLRDCLARAPQEMPRLLAMALDVADAMRFCHSKLVYHCDLKSQNVCVMDNWRCKITDFGLARCMLPGQANVTSIGAVTEQYAAPELIDESLGTEGEVPPLGPCDVYSFGVILWELLTKQRPWEGLSSTKIIAAVLKGKGLEVPVGLSDSGVGQLLTSCLSRNAQKRPIFEVVSNVLAALIDAGDEEIVVGWRGFGRCGSKRGGGSDGSGAIGDNAPPPLPSPPAIDAAAEAAERERRVRAARVPPSNTGELIFTAVKEETLPPLRLLLEEWRDNAVINWANPANDGFTPLHAASYNGKVEALRLLVATAGENTRAQLPWLQPD